VHTTRITTPAGEAGRTEAAPSSPEPQLVMGRFRLVRRLGAGAFATVYAARDERLGRDVALKVMPPSAAVEQRLTAEARAAARLSHPAIVTLFEAVSDDEGAYIVSELVRGSTLRGLLESGRLSDRDVLRIGVAVADALAHAHAHGVIHRDVKPSNVLIPARRGADTPAAKLTDFGVAQVIGGPGSLEAGTGLSGADEGWPAPGEVVGTLDYMPPEQAEGRVAGPEADLYSLALVIYEALTDVNPVRAARVRTHRGAQRLAPLRQHRRELPAALGSAIDQALRPRPSERGGLQELRSALLACLPDVGEEAARTRRRATQVARRPERRAPPATADGPRAPDAGRPGRAAEPKAGGTRAAAVRVPERGLAALAAALTAWWLCGHLLTRAPLTPVLLGLIAAVAVLVAPRLAAASLFVVFAVLAVAEGRPGGALVLAVLAVATVIALAGAGRLWAAPAGAAALGLLGLGTAWPAVAGMSGLSFPRRAGLAAAGFVWATAAGALVHAPAPWLEPHLPAPAAWTRSLPLALHRLILAPATDRTLGPAVAVWAVAAVLVPWIARRLPAAAALVAIAVWSAATVAAVEAAGARPLAGAALGAVGGGLLAAAGPLLALARATARRGAVQEALP
jgi:hypothetical protein